MIKKIKVFGKVHLCRDSTHVRKNYPTPNYRGSGLALFAIMDEGENMDSFLQELEIRKALKKLNSYEKKKAVKKG